MAGGKSLTKECQVSGKEENTDQGWNQGEPLRTFLCRKEHGVKLKDSSARKKKKEGG